MQIKLTDEKIKEIEDLTITDYEFADNILPLENVESLIDDLLTEIHKLQSKVKDLENDIDNNYELKRIDPYEEYGVSERDFI